MENIQLLVSLSSRFMLCTHWFSHVHNVFKKISEEKIYMEKERRKQEAHTRALTVTVRNMNTGIFPSDFKKISA